MPVYTPEKCEFPVGWWGGFAVDLSTAGNKIIVGTGDLARIEASAARKGTYLYTVFNTDTKGVGPNKTVGVLDAVMVHIDNSSTGTQYRLLIRESSGQWLLGKDVISFSTAGEAVNPVTTATEWYQVPSITAGSIGDKMDKMTELPGDMSSVIGGSTVTSSLTDIGGGGLFVESDAGVLIRITTMEFQEHVDPPVRVGAHWNKYEP